MRVVAGKFRGRRLRAPPGKSTRPTTGQVREALFNVLGADVQGARVLDVYAGSGSLGIEALSRGAGLAVFVEASAAAAGILRENLASLGIVDEETALVVQRRLEQSIHLLEQMGPYDFVLVDPPFAMVRNRESLRALERLVAANTLGAGARLILEFPSDQADPAIQGLSLDNVRAYGDTRLAFYAPVVKPAHNALGD
jgi:16S rRNA (guanine966-N2)-methyltransferase